MTKIQWLSSIDLKWPKCLHCVFWMESLFRRRPRLPRCPPSHVLKTSALHWATQSSAMASVSYTVWVLLLLALVSSASGNGQGENTNYYLSTDTLIWVFKFSGFPGKYVLKGPRTFSGVQISPTEAVSPSNTNRSRFAQIQAILVILCNFLSS